MSGQVKMRGVHEYSEGYDVELISMLGFHTKRGDRLVVLAVNEGGQNSTAVDLLDLIEWLKKNRQELLS